MSRKSSIDRLPLPIREKIGQLLQSNHTLDEIVNHLAKLDVDVSRSALGRHSKKVSQVVEMMNRSRTVATAIADKFGDEEGAKVQRVNLEIMHTLLHNLMVGGEDGESITLDPKDAMFLATAFEKLGKADKSHIETQIKLAEERMRIATQKELADKASSAARKKGISAETADEIKSVILGVKL